RSAKTVPKFCTRPSANCISACWSRIRKTVSRLHICRGNWTRRVARTARWSAILRVTTRNGGFRPMAPTHSSCSRGRTHTCRLRGTPASKTIRARSRRGITLRWKRVATWSRSTTKLACTICWSSSPTATRRGVSSAGRSPTRRMITCARRCTTSSASNCASTHSSGATSSARTATLPIGKARARDSRQRRPNANASWPTPSPWRNAGGEFAESAPQCRHSERTGLTVAPALSTRRRSSIAWPVASRTLSRAASAYATSPVLMGSAANWGSILNPRACFTFRVYRRGVYPGCARLPSWRARDSRRNNTSLKSYLGLEYDDGPAAHFDPHRVPVRKKDLHIDYSRSPDGFSLYRAESQRIPVRSCQSMFDEVRAQRSVGVTCHGIFRDADRRRKHAAVSKDTHRIRIQGKRKVAIATDDRTQLGQTRQIRLHRVEGIPAIESDEDFRMPRRHGLYGASRVDVSFGQAQRGYQGVSRFLRQWRRELDRTLCHRDTTTRHERDLAKAIAPTQRERGRRGLGLVPGI